MLSPIDLSRKTVYHSLLCNNAYLTMCCLRCLSLLQTREKSASLDSASVSSRTGPRKTGATRDRNTSSKAAQTKPRPSVVSAARTLSANSEMVLSRHGMESRTKRSEEDASSAELLLLLNTNLECAVNPAKETHTHTAHTKVAARGCSLLPWSCRPDAPGPASS